MIPFSAYFNIFQTTGICSTKVDGDIMKIEIRFIPTKQEIQTSELNAKDKPPIEKGEKKDLLELETMVSKVKGQIQGDKEGFT